MTFKELKKHIKEEQKNLARAIRKGKDARKPSNRNEDNIGYYNALYWNRVSYRHKHIAYCEFFNKTPYEKIENPRKENSTYPFSRSKIDAYKKEWESLLDEEIVCDRP